MWFKGSLLLSYTALLVTPTNAAFRAQVEDLVYLEQKRSSAPELPVVLQPLRRAVAWSNATTSAAETQESDPVVPDPAATPIVVTTDETPSTSSAQPRETSSDRESPSALVTPEPNSSATPSARPVPEPVKSSSIAPAASLTTQAEQPPSSSLVPSRLTPTPSPSSTTEGKIPTSESIESSTSPTPPPPTSAQASSSVVSLVDDVPESTSTVAKSSASPSSTEVESTSVQVPGSSVSLPISTPPAFSAPDAPVSPSNTAVESSFTQAPENTPSPTPSDVASDVPPASDSSTSTPSFSFPAESTSNEIPEITPSPVPSSTDPTEDLSTTPNAEPPVTTITPSDIFQFPTDISSLLSDIASDVGSVVSSFLDVSITTPPVVIPTQSIEDQLSSIFSEIENGASGIGEDVSSIISGILIPSSSFQITGLPIPTSEVLSIISSVANDLPQFTLSLSSSVPVSGSLVIPDTSVLATPTPATTSDVSFSAPGNGASVTSEASITGPAVSEVSGSATNSLATETADLPKFSLLSSVESTTASLGPTPTSSDVLGSSTGMGPTTTPITELPSTAPITTLLPSPSSTGFSGSTNGSLASSPFDTTVTSAPTNILSVTSTSVPDTLIDSQKTSEAPISAVNSTLDSKFPTATSTSNSEITGSGFASSTASEFATTTGGSINPSNVSTSSYSGASASASNRESTLGSSASTQATDAASGSSTASSLQSTVSMSSGFLTTTGYTASVTTPAPATSSTKTAGSGDDAKPAPLTKSQTAGIAIGGTTCLLIALVAAVFLARRYHANASNRKSTGSVYPEIAYLYDPPTGGNDDAEAGGAVPTMSGGATGYGAVPMNSPRNSISSSANPFRDPIIPSPSPSPRLSGYGGPMGDHVGQYAKLEVNPYAFNPVFSEFPPMSPYGARSPQNLPPTPAARVPENRYSDPYADTFEHDLLLNVRSETPDSYVMLAAPPPTPRTMGRLTPENGRYTPENLSVTRTTPELASVHSLAPSSQTNLSMRGPITPPQRAASPPPVHKGWDDIKLDIGGYDMTPPQRGVSPQPANKGWTNIRLDVEEPVPMPAPLSLAPAPRKNLPQRRQPPLAGAGQLLLSGQGLPLTIKPTLARPGTPGSAKVDRGLGLEVPNMTAVYGSPGPMIDEFSQDPTVRKKRSGELLFADPHLVGRPF